MTTTQITRQGTTYEAGRRGTFEIAAEHVLAGDKIMGVTVLKAERTGHFTEYDGVLVEVLELTLDARRGGFSDSRGWVTETHFATLGTAAEDGARYQPYAWVSSLTPAEEA
jgi:hypothetical protein